MHKTENSQKGFVYKAFVDILFYDSHDAIFKKMIFPGNYKKFQ